MRVEATCPAERVSTSYVVNADRDEGYIAIIFNGVGTSGRDFSFDECQSLRFFIGEISQTDFSIGDTQGFENIRRVPRTKDQNITWSEDGNGWFSIDTASIDPKSSGFSLNIPIDALLSRNGADTWAIDLDLISVFAESKIVPNGILPYALEVLTDPDLLVDSIDPALIRTRPFPGAATSYTIELENREVTGNDPVLLGVDDPSQFNTINNTRLQLTLRDPEYAVRRDVGILVLSTLFGIAVTLLFETMLVLSVRQSLAGSSTSGEGQLKTPAKEAIPKTTPRKTRRNATMAHPDLPVPVKTMLANEGHRVHHHLWHFVRNETNWNNLPQADKDSLTADGWAAPRFDQQPGSGIDFLGMHRQMIAMTSQAMASAGDPNWPSVIGWDPIPFEDNNADWSVPEWQSTPPPWSNPTQWQRFTDLANHARSEARVEEMKTIAALFKDRAHLQSVTLDELGIQMEWSIHGWMHMRWSGAPADNAFDVDPDNDWLFLPWSSHVNPTFWKLHGWIDDRIADWEAANNQQADLSQAWSGPMPAAGGMMHMAEARLLKHLPPREEFPMPMSVREPIIEGLLQKPELKAD
ncbi:MAG: hypothetical protein AAGA38_18210 [Pseudomonadota bacterium]